MKQRSSSFVFLALVSSLFLASAASGQPDAQSDAIKADLEQRTALAERLVAAKESPGREFPAAFRASLINALKQEPFQKLQDRAGTGNIAPTALGDTKADLMYTTFQQPCRIIDTRLAGGIIATNQLRDFMVAGFNGFQGQGGLPCNVPLGATAAVINFVAVSPAGQGNLKGAAYPNAIPATGSILNYQLLNPPLAVANGLLFPICDITTATCNRDITLQANAAATHVVADVLGYAMRFPKEKVKNVLAYDFRSSTTTLSVVCANYTGFNVPFTAPANGKVAVHANVLLIVGHNPVIPLAGLYVVNIATAPAVCGGLPARDRIDVYTNDLVPGVGTSLILPLDGLYSVTAGTTLNFTVNGIQSVLAPGDSAQILYATLVAQFIPD